MHLICIILSFIWLAAALQDGEINQEWLDFKLKYKKFYKSSLDDSKSYTKFKENYQIVVEHNKLYEMGKVSYELGINPYSDWNIEDMETYYMGAKLNKSFTENSLQKETFVPSLSNRNLPSTLDWRTKGAIAPVKNQQNCGSCWAFSAIGALESHHFLKTGKLITLSEQNLVDCDTASNGCSGGYQSTAFNYIKNNGGVDTDQSYPYKAKQGVCNFKRENIGATCNGHVRLPAGNENTLLEALATKGPISVAIDASKNFKNYKRGILDDSTCSSTSINHAVLLVGYGTENGHDYWLVKNSWGTDWGEKGYIKMSRNKNNQCAIARQTYYPLV